MNFKSEIEAWVQVLEKGGRCSRSACAPQDAPGELGIAGAVRTDLAYYQRWMVGQLEYLRRA